MATNNSGFNSTYLLVSEERQERERRATGKRKKSDRKEKEEKEEKGKERELTGELAKRIQVENLCRI